MFPAAVNEWAPSVIHAPYFSVTLALKHLFHSTSGAWIYLVQNNGYYDSVNPCMCEFLLDAYWFYFVVFMTFIKCTRASIYDLLRYTRLNYYYYAACDVAFKRVPSQHPMSKWELAQYSLHPVTRQVFSHSSVHRRGYKALIFKLLIKLLWFSLGYQKDNKRL